MIHVNIKFHKVADKTVFFSLVNLIKKLSQENQSVNISNSSSLIRQISPKIKPLPNNHATSYLRQYDLTNLRYKMTKLSASVSHLILFLLLHFHIRKISYFVLKEKLIKIWEKSRTLQVF